jgi:4-amino-4-deoxy-L-arabinose transferase-like glycosyltransferase
MAILGATDFAIRFPSALSGVIAVVLLYFIGKNLGYTKKVSLLASFILSIMPMAIQFSRAAFEVNLAVTLMMAGILCMLVAQKKPYIMLMAVVFFSASMYTYHGLRIIAPLLALGLFVGNFRNYALKYVGVSFAIALLFIFPILSNMKNVAVNQRFAETSLFSVSSAVTETNALRERFGNTLVARIVFHRYWWWGGEMVANYLQNFSPNFLYMKGDENPRHGVRDFGPLYHWQALAILGGIYGMLKVKHRGTKNLVMWMLVVPLATMMTKTNPHTLRMLPIAPAFALLSAWGLSVVCREFPWKKWLVGGTAIIIMVEAYMFGHAYILHYPTESAADWQYGYRQAVEYVESIKSPTQKIYFTRDYGRPSIYALWYGKYAPAEIQKQDASMKKDQQELLAFGQYDFVAEGQYEPGSLVVTALGKGVASSTKRNTIFFPNGLVAFEVYETH